MVSAASSMAQPEVMKCYKMIIDKYNYGTRTWEEGKPVFIKEDAYISVHDKKIDNPLSNKSPYIIGKRTGKQAKGDMLAMTGEALDKNGTKCKIALVGFTNEISKDTIMLMTEYGNYRAIYYSTYIYQIGDKGHW